MSDYITEKWREDTFNTFLASALQKGIEAKDSGALVAALAEFENALKVMPNSRPVLECCAMNRSMLDRDKSATLELLFRASRNQHGRVSENAAGARQLVWVEFMKWCTYQPMIGKSMEVKYEEILPGLPPKFERNSGPQVFTGGFHFRPTIERVADEVVLTMTLEHVEIGVSNFLTEHDFQGYFIYAYEIDISPTDLWKSQAKLSTVKALDTQSQQLVQLQQTAGYAAQVGIGGGNFIPTFTAQYSTSEAMSTFTAPEVMIASRDHEDENVMKCAWMVKAYEDGKPFVMEPVWKIHKLPYPPKKHGFSTPFQGTWVMPLDVAVQLEYEFEWKIQLKAKFALFPRTLKRKCLKKWLPPLTYDFPPHFSVETSDFSGASTARMLQI